MERETPYLEATATTEELDRMTWAHRQLSRLRMYILGSDKLTVVLNFAGQDPADWTARIADLTPKEAQ